MALLHGNFKYITLARPLRYVRKTRGTIKTHYFFFCSFYREKKMLTRSVCRRIIPVKVEK
ncbi:hypothetical protein GHT06_008333 [Daphnia sinensis]|uniref:Uncharacterized protein n=1 Tax=Daphnia sinensis TaxID=1820382 RepID=A0AAD5L416_9CRUS|nr:hypothetical protein GHT06_008333 [Daphnia sinensis]